MEIVISFILIYGFISIYEILKDIRNKSGEINSNLEQILRKLKEDGR